MPTCGSFSHDLLDPRDKATWEGMRLVRCTIVSIESVMCTASVELGEDPPAGVPIGELTDIDCPDIPVFAGDGWSEDGRRRRLNSVPIYYHCQGSTGTVAELKLGHMAFNVPLVELTSPPYSSGDVNTQHQKIVREKALLLFMPATAAEKAAGIEGYRYIIGHTDRNDISPCKSEYICLRINDGYVSYAYFSPPDDTIANPDFGHSSPGKTVVNIIDPIGKRTYRGLEPYGITFPCLASTIIDKVLSITLNDSTPLADIAFLDTLHTITPYWQNAFVYTLLYNLHNDIYIFDANGHAYYPERLHWLTHFFDYGLQCLDNTDKRLLSQPYTVCRVSHMNSGEVPVGPYTDTYPAEFPLLQDVFDRKFQRLTGGDYGAYSDDTLDQPLSGYPQASYTKQWLNGSDYLSMFNDWVYEVGRNPVAHGFFSSDTSYPAAGFMTVSGSHNYVGATGYTGLDITISLYAPWVPDPAPPTPQPWYSFTLVNSSEGIPFNTIKQPFIPYIYSEALAIGRRGSYGVSAVVHGEPGAFISKGLYAYTPSLNAHVSTFAPMPGASDFLTTVLGEMFEMHYATGWDGFYSSMSAFVIDVVE